MCFLQHTYYTIAQVGISCKYKSRIQNIRGKNSYFSLQYQSFLPVNFFLFVEVLLIETLKNISNII